MKIKPPQSRDEREGFIKPDTKEKLFLEQKSRSYGGRGGCKQSATNHGYPD